MWLQPPVKKGLKMKDWLGCCPHARHLYSVICAHHSQSNWQEQKQKAGPHCSGPHLNYCARCSSPLLSAPREFFSSCESIFRILQSSVICETSPNQTCRQALTWEIRCSPAFEALLFSTVWNDSPGWAEETASGQGASPAAQRRPTWKKRPFKMGQFNLRCKWCFSCWPCWGGIKEAYGTVLAAQVHFPLTEC